MSTVPAGDWGASMRRDEYEFRLVDPLTLNDLGEAFDVEDSGGSITFGTYTDNLYSGSLTIVNEDTPSQMVRVVHRVKLPDGTSVSEDLATMFVDGSSAYSLGGVVKRSLHGYSSLYRYTQDVLASDFSRTVGDLVIDEVRSLVEDNGGHLLVGPGVDESRAHTQAVWFEIGTNIMEVLQQIATWTLAEISVDGYGNVVWNPYIEPMLRPLAYTFEVGRNCTYVDGFTLDDLRAESVNRVIAMFSRESKQDDDPYPLSDSVTVDLPDNHSYSFASIGRHKTHVIQVSDPCSHDELQQIAQRYLDENSGNAWTYTIKHVGLPNLRPGDKVRYINLSDGEYDHDAICLITEMDMELGPLNMCTTKMKKIGEP